MVKYPLEDHEKELIRFLVKKYLESNTRCVRFEEIPESLLREKPEAVLWRLQGLGLTKQLTYDRYTIEPDILKALEQIDTPRDYWQEETAWFRSRWWSLPLLAFVVGLPTIVNWIKMLQVVFGWFGIEVGASPR